MVEPVLKREAFPRYLELNAMSNQLKATPALRDGFTQVVVWPGTILGDSTVEDLEKFILDNLGTRAQYLECIITKPDFDDRGYTIPETGGRSDLIFAIHKEDIMKFAMPRFEYGMRWIEDVLATCNHSRHLYDCDYLQQYCTWNANDKSAN